MIQCISDIGGSCPSFRARVVPFTKLLPIEVVKRTTSNNLWLHRVIRPTPQKSLVFDYDDGLHLFSRDNFKSTVERTNIVLAGCDTLAEAALDAGAKDVRIWRTGVDINAYKVNTHTDVACPLVWTGTKSTLQYLLGFTDILSKAKQAVRIICDTQPTWQIPHDFIVWSPETQTTGLIGCSIGLAPLPDTAWTRSKCAFKIVQYMAAGLPVVASAVGANVELFQQYGCKGICAKTDQELLDGILWLQSDPSERQRMGLANRKIAEQYFDHKILATILAKALSLC